MPESESALPLAELQPPEKIRSPRKEAVPRQIATRVAQLALSTAYRAIQSDSREPYLRPPDTGSITRLVYETEDGWRIPLLRLEPRPGASGEPVLLARGLAFNHHSFHYERHNSLAWALRDAGFSVYLFCHRGDTEASPPAGPWKGFDFDDIAAEDMPAAIEALLDHSGFEKVHIVGHALGGQLLYAWMASDRGRHLASASSLCAATTFPRRTTGARAVGFARQLIPNHIRLPHQRLSTLLSPAVRSGGELSQVLGAHRVTGEVLRGLMVHATADLPSGLLSQALTWMESGSLCDRTGRLDYVEALSGLEVPMQVIACKGDEICPPEHALGILDHLRGPTDCLVMDSGWGHLDPLLANDARKTIIPRIVGWFEEHRKLAWGVSMNAATTPILLP